MKDSLYGCDGKSASCCLMYPVGCFPGHIDCGKRSVVSQGESVGNGGLPMLKPCVLLRVPIEELDLESGVVNEEYLSGSQSKIGASVSSCPRI